MNEKFYIDLIKFIILLVIYIILVISEMRIFKKAGEKSYKALIPFYNVYLSHKIVGMHHIWFVIEMILWVGEVVTAIVKLNHTVELSFSIITLVFTAVSEIIHATKMCNCFGKGKGYKIGIVFLPEVFLPIIAFGKSEYKKETSIG